ncbi:MAG: hypothetical protein AMK71_02560 [Nitrospira bacterium SG8_35_4]|nr:MAG: hypothetical protein AMK71_02560 [Nitrospira bacterium SG8_35_4]
MKERSKSYTFDDYKDNQIEKAATDDLLLLVAKELVKAKDQDGVNLFWDSEEENFMRKYILYTEDSVCC